MTGKSRAKVIVVAQSDEPDHETNARVSAHRYKKCDGPHEGATAPRFLPWPMSNYVLNKYLGISPPSHLTTGDVTSELVPGTH